MGAAGKPPVPRSVFLDEWLAKRKAAAPIGQGKPTAQAPLPSNQKPTAPNLQTGRNISSNAIDSQEVSSTLMSYGTT